MVRLTPVFYPYVRAVFVYFNSKMVRLTPASQQPKIFDSAKFQFQNGTINSILKACLYGTGSKFQFQNGTINSREQKAYIGGMINFNSKMVRLTLSQCLRKNEIYTNFNSKMVRLTQNCILSVFHFLFDFNSKMVRLTLTSK